MKVLKIIDFDLIRRNLKRGWLPDLPDIRDLPFALIRRKLWREMLPSDVDLRLGCSAVEDQGNLGSCTANAIAGALEFLDKVDGKVTEASRLFIYWFERERIGQVLSDSGAYIRDGVKVCRSKGYCDEALWPYDVAQFKRRPNQAARLDAAKRIIKGYYRCATLADVKAALASGLPVVFGFSVYSSAMTDAVAKTGDIPLPSTSDTQEGGHAVLAVGYDDATQRLRFRNSWGVAWGDKGYGTLPYGYITDRNLSDDFWVISKL